MYEELVRGLRRCSYTTVAGCDREDGYCKPCAYFNSNEDITCMDMMMIDAADALESSDKNCAYLGDRVAELIAENEELKQEIERLKEASRNWELFEMANLKAWREAFEECYGENGTQRWDKNPDIKVFSETEDET